MSNIPENEKINPNMKEVLSYVEQHISELFNHGQGGKTMVWIYREKNGQLSHAFNHEKVKGTESYGGKLIPVSCVDTTGKFFREKKEKIREYIRSFNISEKDADAIIGNIQWAPMKERRI